jgi:hypothetical protein
LKIFQMKLKRKQGLSNMTYNDSATKFLVNLNQPFS